MTAQDTDRAFAGSIPHLYETHLVPLIFEPYAKDLADRVATIGPSSILEIAAGTGVVTRHLARALPASTSIVATDLNQPMLDLAASLGTSRAIQWRQADAMKLPFADKTFDVVVCQFGVMFFPDKAVAFSEAYRVLRPGGTFLFNVWDRIEANEFAHTVTQSLVPLFPTDPPRFMARIPHGYHEQRTIAADVARGGFSSPALLDTIGRRSRADSPRIPAIAYCQGTPLRNEIESRGEPGIAVATEAAAAAVASRFGSGVVESNIQAHVITVAR